VRAPGWIFGAFLAVIVVTHVVFLALAVFVW